MAARRQPAAAAAAAASPAGLKIKVKAGVKVAAKEGGEEEGDGVVSARMLKRKRLTPPGSPASKRPPNTANGGSNLADLNAVNGKLTESVEHDEAVVQSQGELQVTKDVAEQTKAAADTADVVGDQSQLVATGVQVSSSQATSSLTNVAEEVMHHTIPSHAGWFSWTEIHTLEKRGLPEFFSGKVPGKTPEMYLEYRNTIMKKYREHLGTVLTVADMQEHLSGVDEKAIHRVMEFLDHWGLINYQAPAEFLPSWKHAGPVLESDAALMLRALPRKGSSLYHFDATHAPVPQQTLMANPKTTDAAVIAEMLAFGEGPEVEYHCNSCSADCSKQRYHCQKQADFDLCPNCYEQKQYGPDMAATDFIKMDVTEASNANGGGWTDQETLLLLEALELYGDNWNEIAEHVATKSKSQCILHFIRLPVEDSFTEDADGPAAVTNSAAPATTPISQTDSTLEGEQEDKETAEKAAPEDAAAAAATVSSADNDEEEPWSRELVVPPNLAAFSEAGNPVMAQMAFLATMIGAKLGGEAAQSALAALVTKDPGVHLAAGTAMILEDPAVVDVERSSSENPGRSVQADEETQSGDEPAATGDAATAPAAAPSLSDGAKTPVPDSTASAQNDDDAPSQSEPNLAGKDVVKDDGKDFQKTESVPVTLDVMEEAKVAGRVKRAAASAIAAAAVKAKLLADQEEREMQRLIAGVIEQQQKKMELKLKFLNELEAAFGKECEQVERNRLNFFTDDARIAASHMGGSSHSNPPPSPPRLQQLQQLQHHQQHHQQQQQQHQHQAMVQAQQPPSQMMYQQQQQQQHGFHHQMPATQAAFMQSQMYQGLANSVNAGAMTMQLSHFGRQMMMQPPPHHMMLQQQQQQQLQRPQEISPPQVNLGRAMMGSDPLPGMPQ